MLALPHSDAVISTVIALGLVSGLPAGPIMSLPARVLKPADPRDRHGPVLHPLLCRDDAGAGHRRRLRQMDRQRGAAFDFGAAVLLACPVLLWVFNRIAAARPLAA